MRQRSPERVGFTIIFEEHCRSNLVFGIHKVANTPAAHRSALLELVKVRGIHVTSKRSAYSTFEHSLRR